MSKRGKYGQGRVFHPTYTARDGSKQELSKWYIQFYDQEGHQRKEPTDATTEKEARGILAERIAGARKGTISTVAQKGIRYGTLRAKTLEVAQAANLKSLELLTNGEYSLRGMTKLDELFGYRKANGELENPGMKMEDFTSDKWDDFVKVRRAEGVSDGTIRSSGKLLRRMYAIGLDKGLLHESDVKKIALPKPPEAKDDYVTLAQFRKMCSFLDPKFHPYVTWLFYQATRKTEALGIVWGQVDLNKAEYYPDASKNKTGDSSTKVLVAPVIAALKNIGRRNDEDRVFEGVTKKTFIDAWRDAALKSGEGYFAFVCGQCKAVKDGKKPKEDDPVVTCDVCRKDRKRVVPMQYQYTGITIHGLRRSAVTLYAEGGMTLKEIMEITGHIDPKIAAKYMQSNTKRARQLANEAIAAHGIAVPEIKQLTAGD
jgi:integrase